MSTWMECTRCHHAHDVGPVEVVARYADCSVWKCPRCKSLIDDRPMGWGGSARPCDPPIKPRRYEAGRGHA